MGLMRDQIDVAIEVLNRYTAGLVPNHYRMVREPHRPCRTLIRRIHP
jgi:hypothetical protein